MRIPANLITGSYTSGTEFVYKQTNVPYKGYYYSLNNSYYTGKSYNSESIEIITLSQANSLLSDPDTAVYAFISGITSQQLQKEKITSIQVDIENNPVLSRYFCSNVNVYPKLIKEISKATYDSIKNDPLYQTTFLDSTQGIDQADKQLPGLKTWLLG
jgi:hypothetical protein